MLSFNTQKYNFISYKPINSAKSCNTKPLNKKVSNDSFNEHTLSILRAPVAGILFLYYPHYFRI